MDEDEARRVASTLRRLGIRGIVSPEDLDDPAGQWRVYDSTAATRRDITDEALTIIKGMSRTAGPAGPARGFIVPIPR